MIINVFWMQCCRWSSEIQRDLWRKISDERWPLSCDMRHPIVQVQLQIREKYISKQPAIYVYLGASIALRFTRAGEVRRYIATSPVGPRRFEKGSNVGQVLSSSLPLLFWKSLDELLPDPWEFSECNMPTYITNTNIERSDLLSVPSSADPQSMIQ